MGTWEMTCECGDMMKSEGETKEQAVNNMMGIMTPAMVAQHVAEKHEGKPVPTQDQVRMGLLATAQPV